MLLENLVTFEMKLKCVQTYTSEIRNRWNADNENNPLSAIWTHAVGGCSLLDDS